MGYKMSNMTLDEAIEHCKKVAKEQENCNVGCSLEHRQLAIWLSALKAITENNYSTKSNMDKCNLKKYIGTKVVEARPMNEIYAESVGYARKNIDNHEWREGYHVRYTNPDGSTYDSWSPKSVFEEAYKPSDTVLDRLKIERNELRERIEKLEDFIGLNFSEAAEKAGSLQAALLVCQRSYMVNYLDVLETRIDLIEKETGN